MKSELYHEYQNIMILNEYISQQDLEGIKTQIDAQKFKKERQQQQTQKMIANITLINPSESTSSKSSPNHSNLTTSKVDTGTGYHNDETIVSYAGCFQGKSLIDIPGHSRLLLFVLMMLFAGTMSSTVAFVPSLSYGHSQQVSYSYGMHGGSSIITGKSCVDQIKHERTMRIVSSIKQQTNEHDDDAVNPQNRRQSLQQFQRRPFTSLLIGTVISNTVRPQPVQSKEKMPFSSSLLSSNEKEIDDVASTSRTANERYAYYLCIRIYRYLLVLTMLLDCFSILYITFHFSYLETE